MTVGGPAPLAETRRGVATGLTLLYAAANLIGSGVLRHDRPVAETVIFAGVSILGAVIVLVWRQRVPAAVTFLSVPLIITILCVLSLPGPADALRVMDGGLLVGVGVYCGWFYSTFRFWVGYLTAFAAGCACYFAAALAGAVEFLVVLWGSSTMAVLAVGVCVVVGLLRISEQRLADTDWLTGALNRRGLDRYIAEHVNRRRTQPAAETSVIVIDLDHFKAINDRIGHAGGDEVLARLAAVWRTVLRASDGLARTGGDEFVVILPDTTSADAAGVLERVRQLTPTRFSAGCATLHPGDTISDTLETADRDLYTQKDARKHPFREDPESPDATD